MRGHERGKQSPIRTVIRNEVATVRKQGQAALYPHSQKDGRMIIQSPRYKGTKEWSITRKKGKITTGTNDILHRNSRTTQNSTRPYAYLVHFKNLLARRGTSTTTHLATTQERILRLTPIWRQYEQGAINPYNATTRTAPFKNTCSNRRN